MNTIGVLSWTRAKESRSNLKKVDAHARTHVVVAHDNEGTEDRGEPDAAQSAMHRTEARNVPRLNNLHTGHQHDTDIV